MSEHAIVKEARVGDKILITEASGVGCVAIPPEEVDDVIDELEAYSGEP